QRGYWERVREPMIRASHPRVHRATRMSYRVRLSDTSERDKRMTSKKTQRIAEWLVLSSSLCLVNCENGPASMATADRDGGVITPKGDAHADAAPETGGSPAASTGGSGGSAGHVSA